MSFISCYDVATIATDGATDLFIHLGKQENEELKRVFCGNCKTIDYLLDKFCCKELSISVDTITTDIEISLDCKKFSITNGNSKMLTLLNSSSEISIDPSDCMEDGVKVTFRLNGIWSDVV